MQMSITLRQVKRHAATTMVSLELLAAGFGGAVAIHQLDLHHQPVTAPIAPAPVYQVPSFDDFRYFDQNTNLPSGATAPNNDASSAPVAHDPIRFWEQNTQLPKAPADTVPRGGHH